MLIPDNWKLDISKYGLLYSEVSSLTQRKIEHLTIQKNKSKEIMHDQRMFFKYSIYKKDDEPVNIKREWRTHDSWLVQQ